MGASGLILAAAFLLLRSALLPVAWGMKSESAAYYVRKAIFLLASRPYTLAVSFGPWVLLAAAFGALAITAWVRAPRRPSVVWLVLAVALVSGLLAEFVGGNFALLTIPTQLGALGTLTLFALGLVVLAHVRVAWPWLLLAMALVVHVPLLWVWGPHYFYWPAAFWALVSAGLWRYVLLCAADGTIRWRPPAPLTEQTSG